MGPLQRVLGFVWSVSNWWATNTLYYGGQLVNGVPSGGAVSSSVTLRGELSVPANSAWGVSYDPYYDDTVLTSVSGVVTKSIQTAGWPTSANAIYVVYTDSSITQVGRPQDGIWHLLILRGASAPFLPDLPMATRRPQVSPLPMYIRSDICSAKDVRALKTSLAVTWTA